MSKFSKLLNNKAGISRGYGAEYEGMCQQISIRETITENKGETLPEVNVMVIRNIAGFLIF